ncbi:MAG: hypothetical protein FJX29_15565 [Alphaproteobacteria bacterium]|nr:hypothetical protein [Alphaproteobacteria bacterium]
MLKLLCATTALAICVCASAAGGQTLPPASSPADAYARGCASCHASEQRILRAIPSLDDEKRAAWIRQFMAGHPCERDDLKPQIEQYLLEKSRR